MPSCLSRWLAPLALAAGAVTPAAARAQQAPPARPTLVVFLTIDQFRPDYLDRWRGQLTGGLARLSQHGAFFTNAFQEHAITETAPGHSVTMSGRFPRSTGILRNTAGVEDPQAPLLTSRDPGASPFRFRGSVLMDWLRTRDARSRGLSVSRKDRGAILPMGRAKQPVFWYATTNGEFTTSRYYADTLPDWIRRINARRTAQRTAGRAWTPLLPAGQYAEPDSVPQENNGKEFLFPHAQPADTEKAVANLPYTPWMDPLTLDVALEGIQTLGLGTGEATDVVAISLSATDYIGHRYGPDSREQHDNIVRLDRALGTFIDSLYKLRDSSEIVFALTADHGVTSYPAVAAARKGGRPATYFDLRPVMRNTREALRAARVDTTALQFDSGLLYVDRDRFARAGVDPAPILQRTLAALRATPGVVRVDRVADLARMDTTRDVVARRWAHMIPPDAPVEYVYTTAEGAYPVTATIAEHGEPYDDDAHVPVIFYGPWFRAARIADRAYVADMAPTLAHVLGVPPTERVDGRVLTQALAGPARR